MSNENDEIVVEISQEGYVARIVINRPDKLNALTMLMRGELRRAIERLDSDPSVRAIVVSGAGDQAFSAGGDIAGFLELEPHQLTNLHENIAAPERCSKPVIAAVKGYCFGAGLEFSLACDFIVATDDSQFALPEIRLGMIPGSGGSQRVVRQVGLARAKDMIMRGRRISATEAESWGLITRAVRAEDWPAVVDGLARELAELSPLALRYLKRALNNAYSGPLQMTLEMEGLAYGVLRSSRDFGEGVRAFLEKRKPDFTGE